MLRNRGQRLCEARAEFEDHLRCFRDAVVEVYEKSGLTGYATDLVVGAGAPFTMCTDGFCRFAGGGSLYTCERLDANRVRECEGYDEEDQRCSETDCPLRQCKMICGKSTDDAL